MWDTPRRVRTEVWTEIFLDTHGGEIKVYLSHSTNTTLYFSQVVLMMRRSGFDHETPETKLKKEFLKVRNPSNSF